MKTSHEFEFEGELYDEDSCICAGCEGNDDNIKSKYFLGDYVILSSKKRCYLGENCQPIDDVCECM